LAFPDLINNYFPPQKEGFALNNGFGDPREICCVESFEIKFADDNWRIFKDIPFVMEWHQWLSPLIYDEFKRIENCLNKRSF